MKLLWFPYIKLQLKAKLREVKDMDTDPVMVQRSKGFEVLNLYMAYGIDKSITHKELFVVPTEILNEVLVTVMGFSKNVAGKSNPKGIRFIEMNFHACVEFHGFSFAIALMGSERHFHQLLTQSKNDPDTYCSTSLISPVFRKDQKDHGYQILF